MAHNNKKTNHDDFRRVVNNLRSKISANDEIQISREDALVIVEHGDWFSDYTESRRLARSMVKNPGPAQKPDSEIKPGTKAVREFRARQRAAKLLAEETKQISDKTEKTEK